MTAPHLLLVLIPTTALTFLFSWLQKLAGVPLSFEVRYWTSFPIAFVVSIVVAWPLARIFRVPPLMIFSGPCPDCRRRPPGWWAAPGTGDRLALQCGNCGERVELWLKKPSQPSDAGFAVPSYALRAPKFLGLWRRIDMEPLQRKRHG
jgi:hypothetical protein